jgi:hypothetical protein
VPKDHELPLTLQPSPKAPPTYKSYWYITVPITLLLILAWRNRSSVADYIGTHDSALTSSTLDSEAKAEGTKVFDGMVSKCGDRYYIWGGEWNQYHEVINEIQKKPSISSPNGPYPPFFKTPVSDVDRMNGLTWDGGWNFAYSIYRVLHPHETGPWQEGSAFGIEIKKLNGVWLVHEGYHPETWGKWIPVDSFNDNVPCEKVSEYYSQNGVSRTDTQ